jgi:hypothetical protein
VTPEGEDGMPQTTKAIVLSVLPTPSLQLEEGVVCSAISPDMRYFAAFLLIPL